MNSLHRFIALISLLTLGVASAETNGDFRRPTSAAVPFSGEIVAAHNQVRTKVGVPPLVWSDELAQVAQSWANQLITRGEFAHSRNNSYGENLYEISGSGASSNADRVVSAWAAESASYRYASNSCAGVCGHYTQIVWKQTQTVGCGVARDSNREVWVCNYAPFGNIIGEKPY